MIFLFYLVHRFVHSFFIWRNFGARPPSHFCWFRSQSHTSCQIWAATGSHPGSFLILPPFWLRPPATISAAVAVLSSMDLGPWRRCKVCATCWPSQWCQWWCVLWCECCANCLRRFDYCSIRVWLSSFLVKRLPSSAYWCCHRVSPACHHRRRRHFPLGTCWSLQIAFLLLNSSHWIFNPDCFEHQPVRHCSSRHQRRLHSWSFFAATCSDLCFEHLFVWLLRWR